MTAAPALGSGWSSPGSSPTGWWAWPPLAVTAFVAAKFQHSPANMGYFALWMAETGSGPGWATALVWNIIPAGLGNIVGATLLGALPFRYVFEKGSGG